MPFWIVSAEVPPPPATALPFFSMAPPDEIVQTLPLASVAEPSPGASNAPLVQAEAVVEVVPVEVVPVEVVPVLPVYLSCRYSYSCWCPTRRSRRWCPCRRCYP